MKMVDDDEIFKPIFHQALSLFLRRQLRQTQIEYTYNAMILPIFYMIFLNHNVAVYGSCLMIMLTPLVEYRL